MTMASTQLVSLIGSRICHDLISPIGAISNGVELLAMTQNGTAGQEMQLLQDSCQNANARIRFFRVAFGSAQSDQILPLRELHDVLQSLNLHARVTLRWMAEQAPTRREAQAGFLAAMCQEAALTRGGTVSILQDDTGLLIKGTGPMVQVDPEVWDHLTMGTALDISPAQVQFAMLRLVTADIGARLSKTSDETQITLTIRWP